MVSAGVNQLQCRAEIENLQSGSIASTDLHLQCESIDNTKRIQCETLPRMEQLSEATITVTEGRLTQTSSEQSAQDARTEKDFALPISFGNDLNRNPATSTPMRNNQTVMRNSKRPRLSS